MLPAASFVPRATDLLPLVCLCIVAIALFACGGGDDSRHIPGGNTEIIGPEGGTVSAGGAVVDIPEGALSALTPIGIQRTTTDLPPPPGYALVGAVFAFMPHGTAFAVPVSVSMPYSGPEAGLVVLRLDNLEDVTWEVLETGTFAGGIATIQVSRFSLMGVAGPAQGADRDTDAGDAAPGDTAEAEAVADGDVAADADEVEAEPTF